MLKIIATPAVFVLPVLMLSSVAKATTLPAIIEQNQNLLAQEGTCEGSWHDLADSVGVQEKDLGDGNVLWIVPCANWSVNLQVTAYLQIPESTQPDGVITKPISFVNYDPYKGLHAESTLDNPQFDDKALTLAGHDYFESNSECASASLFRWNSGLQSFDLQKLIKNDVCSGVGKWETVYPVNSPSLAVKWLEFLRQALRQH